MDRAEAQKAAAEAMAKVGLKPAHQVIITIEGTSARITTSTPGATIVQK